MENKQKAKTYKSDFSNTLHEMASAMHEAGAIDKKTMRHFDEACLASIPQFKPEN